MSPNAHPFDESLLSAYLDGELEANERAEVESALQRRPELRELLKDLKEIRAVFEQAPELESSVGLTQRIMDEIQDRDATPQLSGPSAYDATPANPADASRPSVGPTRIWYVLATLAASGLIYLSFSTHTPQLASSPRTDEDFDPRIESVESDRERAVQPTFDLQLESTERKLTRPFRDESRTELSFKEGLPSVDEHAALEDSYEALESTARTSEATSLAAAAPNVDTDRLSRDAMILDDAVDGDFPDVDFAIEILSVSNHEVRKELTTQLRNNSIVIEQEPSIKADLTSAPEPAYQPDSSKVYYCYVDGSRQAVEETMEAVQQTASVKLQVAFMRSATTSEKQHAFGVPSESVAAEKPQADSLRADAPISIATVKSAGHAWFAATPDQLHRSSLEPLSEDLTEDAASNAPGSLGRVRSSKMTPAARRPQHFDRVRALIILREQPKQ